MPGSRGRLQSSIIPWTGYAGIIFSESRPSPGGKPHIPSRSHGDPFGPAALSFRSGPLGKSRQETTGLFPGGTAASSLHSRSLRRPWLRSHCAGFAPSASMPPDRNRPFREYPAAPPFILHQEQPGAFPEKFPAEVYGNFSPRSPRKGRRGRVLFLNGPADGLRRSWQWARGRDGFV